VGQEALVVNQENRGAASVCWSEPVRRSDATAVVLGGVQDLKEKLGAARAGDEVWASERTIGLAWEHHIEIPAGVTLASSRDKLHEGALLYTNRRSSDPKATPRPVFRPRDGAHVTGLRFREPSWTTAKQHDVSAMRIDDPVARVQVDRNEFYHWTRAGVFIEGAGHQQAPDIVRITRHYFSPQSGGGEWL
jgi:hypothetical protein